ncbi:biorientation of chromosomes in cell division protein 1-like 1 isoform X1 [Bombyx mori]|uniref:BOD1/SHG1 domain-containing protein n=1 Tax=Bombyx mori TaxID=7091 RepID=A0A8R2C9S7_BOMMO|nr:biorientation of chromosomes in cell division protein 1-like 1 isoform X1 [Bombyx mori]
MTHLQYMPGDPRLVDQLVYELKSKGIFDQFRKDCIADVDTRPAYQNLRQRVESSVSSFLSRQCWKPDLNKNQLREKLRKHILDGNYLEQGVERIVDQVVNPKVASVFIPQVEDLVYNYLGIVRKKPVPDLNEENNTNLLPTDLEAVSPGSVHSDDGKDATDTQEVMDIEDGNTLGTDNETEKNIQYPNTIEMCVFESDTSIDKSCIPLPDEILPENIPQPENSPPKLDLDKIELPKEPESIQASKFHTDMSDEVDRTDKEYFKPVASDDDDSSSDASLIRNMSPLTPIRNLNNENSCDAQQAFENDSDGKVEDNKEPCTFRFALDHKPDEDSKDNTEKSDRDQTNLAFQFNNQVNIKPFNTPVSDDSSNSNNLQIDYESDANSKTNVENKIPETENSEDVRKEKKEEKKSSSHKSSHRSRDSHRHSSSRDKRSDSKYSSSRDSSRNDKSDKKSKDDSKSKSSHREREKSKDRNDKKESRDSSKHRSSHKSSSSKDSKSHKSSSQRSSKHDEKKSSSQRDKNDKSSDKTKDGKSRDKRDSKSTSHRSDKDRKSSSHKSEKDSKTDDKSKKKDKKDTDDHYSLSGRGNVNRRSTDRDSNDGSSSSKGSHNPPSSKSSESKKETKGSTSKSDNTSYSGDSTSPSDKENLKTTESNTMNSSFKPAVHVDNRLELPVTPVPRLPFVPDVTIKKPKFAANLEEAKRLMKMRRFLDEEQRRMNQEAALLLEFQANVRPSLSQVYSSIPGPELEFACITNVNHETQADSNTTQDSDVLKDFPDDEQGFKGFECPKVNGQRDLSDDSDVEKDIKHFEELRNETYEENKPFSQLVNEISEYSRASERIKNINNEKNTDKIYGSNEKLDEKYKNDSDTSIIDNNDGDRRNLFEVTIITEELSENEDSNKEDAVEEAPSGKPDEELFNYFAEHEKYDSEIERHKFDTFLKKYMKRPGIINKLYVINCDRYVEKILKEISQGFGDCEIVNYHKNGHIKLPKSNVIKEVHLRDEVVLPVEKIDFEESKSRSPILSPVKSECSFELSSDYAAKLEEMVNRTSRQEVMEIILGSVMESPSKMPQIDYYEESTIFCDSLKRKMEPESPSNITAQVLTPNKIRKLSESDQITSTTEETEKHISNNRVQNNSRSKYLGKARRVGLPRPKKNNLPHSPSSDKSVENYEQNALHSPNGKLKTTQRAKIQRYSTTDLYKPKLHYLSRRNNIRP